MLAAGKGTRLLTITENIPKPLILIHGVPLIKYLFDIIHEIFDNIIVVVDYRANDIISFSKNIPYSHKIRYIMQCCTLSGTLGALMSAKNEINDFTFLSICADSIYCKSDIEELTKHPNSMLVTLVSEKEKGGKYLNAKCPLFKHKSGILLDAGAWYLTQNFFHLKPVSSSSELSIPHTIYKSSININMVYAKQWFSVGTHWELNNIEKFIPKWTE